MKFPLSLVTRRFWQGPNDNNYVNLITIIITYLRQDGWWKGVEW